jgi:hypothetical protein
MAALIFNMISTDKESFPIFGFRNLAHYRSNVGLTGVALEGIVFMFHEGSGVYYVDSARAVADKEYCDSVN